MYLQSQVSCQQEESSSRNFVRRQSFFVGGAYIGPESARVMSGQMYVEALIPERVEHALPLVLIHGGAMTAMNWMTTPDGRAGWAEWLANRGWKVYMVDQPARGRSAWQPDHDRPLFAMPTWVAEKYFTAPKDFGEYSQARLHTQWPGTGRVGDPIFDQFYASMVPTLQLATVEPLIRHAGAALLDKIGPAVVLGHSQGGGLTWILGDACPDLVKGIIGLEPLGPPYKNNTTRVPLARKDRLYGLTAEPLAYDPEVTQSSPLEFEQERESGYWSQRGTPRRLVHLAKIPIFVVTSQASFHATYDHLTVRYLKEAGVDVQHVQLADYGIYGNCHMMMLEKNSDEVVAFIEKLLLSFK